jgi:hypothetical protein
MASFNPAPIVSNADTAKDAVSELTGEKFPDPKTTTITLSKNSNLDAMTSGQNLTNALVGGIGGFAQAVVGKADLFPQLAKVIEQNDKGSADKISQKIPDPTR